MSAYSITLHGDYPAENLLQLEPVSSPAVVLFHQPLEQLVVHDPSVPTQLFRLKTKTDKDNKIYTGNKIVENIKYLHRQLFLK